MQTHSFHVFNHWQMVLWRGLYFHFVFVVLIHFQGCSVSGGHVPAGSSCGCQAKTVWQLSAARALWRLAFRGSVARYKDESRRVTTARALFVASPVNVISKVKVLQGEDAGRRRSDGYPLPSVRNMYRDLRARGDLNASGIEEGRPRGWKHLKALRSPTGFKNLRYLKWRCWTL